MIHDDTGSYVLGGAKGSNEHFIVSLHQIITLALGLGFGDKSIISTNPEYPSSILQYHLTLLLF